jgi:hypothetical protein
MIISGKESNSKKVLSYFYSSDIEIAKREGTKGMQNKEVELRDELDSLLKQSVSFSDKSHSYPLLFGDPDQLASRRSTNCI